MKSNTCTVSAQGGAILEKPIPLQTFLGWLSRDGDDGKPREEKCDFDLL